jgi:hypothetical protein
MRSIIIEMNSAYNRINSSGYVSVAQPILSMRDGETLHSRTPQLEALMAVTGYDAYYQRLDGMWNEAMRFSQEVDYLGNCCA